MSVYAFGHEVKSDILKNVGANSGWETIILGALFGIVGALHIPLIFFVGKESFLIIIFTLFYTQPEEKEIEENNDQSNIDLSRFGGFGQNKSANVEHGEHMVTHSLLNRTGNVTNLK